MAKTKFGVGDKVSSETTGFSPYEGPLPKPGTIYSVQQKSAAVRLSGPNSKVPGTPYIKTMWEITEGECKGFAAWYNVVPGEHEMQQTRVAQYMQAVCGRNSADLVHDEIDDGGKITKIGGKNPVGTKAGMTFQRKKDTFGLAEGEEPQWKAETQDIIPGWKSKAVVDEDADDEEEYDDSEAEEDFDEDDAEEEEPAPAPVSRRRPKAEPVAEPEPEEEPEEDEEDSDEEDHEEEDANDSDEDDEEQVSFEDASAMSLVELKKLAAEFEYTAAELAPFKGPAGKKKLIAKLVEDEIVAAEAGDDEPPF